MERESGSGVRKYEDNFGRFTSIDLLFEKYSGWTPYHYCSNDPINYFDNNGNDEEQREQAINKSQEYLNSGSIYKMGAKGNPGKPVDCSGLVSKSVKAGGEPDPNHGDKGSGVLNIEANTQRVDISDIQPGNIVTFENKKADYPYHTGLVTNVKKTDNGDISITFTHSSSKSKGPTTTTFTIGDKSYWGKFLNGFWKWDQKPDTKQEKTKVDNNTTKH